KKPERNRDKKVTVSEVFNIYYNVPKVSDNINEKKDLKQEQDIELDAKIDLKKLINSYLKTLKT
ncbi:4996_t:CDS:1, partial [Scutellospora calospora]